MFFLLESLMLVHLGCWKICFCWDWYVFMSKASGRHKDKKGPLFWGSGSFECPLREKVGGSTKIIGKLESWVVARGWFKL